MFDAVCGSCGKKCKIPFEPKQGRPVKCDDCFRQNRGAGPDKNFRKDFDVVCAKCGKDTTVPFKPVQGKPVLCRECFKKAR